MNSNLLIDRCDLIFNRLIIDSKIAVEFYNTVNNTSFRIESDFNIIRNCNTLSFTIAALTNLDELQLLLDLEVDSCDIAEAGDISLIFSDGTHIHVPHDQQFESWDLNLSNMQIHSIAGYGYAVFRDSND